MSEQTNLQHAYNRFAEQRENTAMEPWKREERERFLDQAKRENKRSLLEIGAGTGRDSLYFQQHGLDVVATDFSEEMVRLCREKGLNARQMDFHQLDFPPETFEAVFALNCLLHVPKAELGGVLAEIRNVLKPDGLFFFGVYGGQDSEGIWEKDNYEPKRFFAMYEDEEIVRIVQRTFHLEDFHIVEMGAGAPHFQSMLSRKQASSR